MIAYIGYDRWVHLWGVIEIGNCLLGTRKSSWRQIPELALGAGLNFGALRCSAKLEHCPLIVASAGTKRSVCRLFGIGLEGGNNRTSRRTAIDARRPPTTFPVSEKPPCVIRY